MTTNDVHTETDRKPGIYYGTTTTRTVCLPTCPVKKAGSRHLIVFDSLEEALAQGYRPCGHCRPEKPGWKGSRHELVEAARQYIEAHSAEKFSLAALSGALYINGSYLLRTFKEATGCTLLWYHNHIRCEKAKELLMRSDLSVSQAGEQTGFASSSHFSHVFKKMEGMTPSEFRSAYFRQLQS